MWNAQVCIIANFVYFFITYGKLISMSRVLGKNYQSVHVQVKKHLILKDLQSISGRFSKPGSQVCFEYSEVLNINS